VSDFKCFDMMNFRPLVHGVFDRVAPRDLEGFNNDNVVGITPIRAMLSITGVGTTEWRRRVHFITRPTGRHPTELAVAQRVIAIDRSGDVREDTRKIFASNKLLTLYSE